MSDRVQGWVWDLDLQPARKLVPLWLAGRATDNGVAFPGEREIRERTGLGERMVRYHLQWLASDRNDNGQPKRPLVVRIERRLTSQRNTSNVYILAVPWQQPDAVRRDLDELRHVTKSATEQALIQVGATGCPQVASTEAIGLPPVGEAGCPEVGATGCREEPSLWNRHRSTPPKPPEGEPQQGKVVVDAACAAVRADADRERTARMLAEAFYHGLGGNAAAVTLPLRKRDVAIARQLVDVGASPGEAEAYAREMAAKDGRIAPIDLRSFERERLGWQARRRTRELDQHRVVDRTGQPPSWQSDRPAQTADFAHVATRSGDGTVPDECGERLTETFRSVLLRRNR